MTSSDHRRRAFIHPGPGKTGSSAIQVHLARSRAALLDAGILYPALGTDLDAVKPGSITSGNAMRLAQQLAGIEAGPGDGFDALRELDRQLGAHKWHSVILSSENFQRCDAEALATVERTLAAHGATCELIYYYRNPFDSLLSRYNQMLKRHGSTQPLKAFVRGSGPPHRNLLRRMIAAFGADSIRIRDYDTCADTAADFCAATGCPAPAADAADAAEPRVNTSLNAAYAHVVRHLNAGLIEPRAASWLTDALVSPPLAETFAGGPLLTLPPDVLEEIERKHADDHAFVQSLCPDLELTFRPPNLAVGDADGRPFTQKDVLALIGVLTEEIGRLRRTVARLQRRDADQP